LFVYRNIIVFFLLLCFVSNVSIVFAESDDNLQSEKISFLSKENSDEDTYSKHTLQKLLSKYQVMSGTLIPGVMISGVNSDLPGQVVAQVSQNVYDSTTGKYLIIPQGTKMIGSYDSNVSYGQERVLIVWNRLIFPNGNSLVLDHLQGVDLSGYSGFHDKVDNHNGRIYMSVILGSLVTAAATIATAKNSSDTSFSAAAGSGVSQNVAQTVSTMLNKNLGIQPTLTIRPGYRFNIFLAKDLILEPYEMSTSYGE
jgi:type IV secretory pathway VirB10-like protein